MRSESILNEGSCFSFFLVFRKSFFDVSKDDPTIKSIVAGSLNLPLIVLNETDSIIKAPLYFMVLL